MCTIDPKTALVFGGFSQRQSQLITLSGEVIVDLVSVPKFTQQIRRCYSIDAFINKDRFKEVTACLQMGPAEYSRQFVRLNSTCLRFSPVLIQQF